MAWQPLSQLGPAGSAWLCTNDGQSAQQSDQTVAGTATCTPSSWAQLFEHLDSSTPRGPYFLELFAGKAGITEAVALQGVPTLPPVDIEPSQLVTSPQDIIDVAFWTQLIAVLVRRLVFFLHCGTPCNTFTAARKLDGGPPPLRSRDAPMGLPNLRDCDQCLVFLGNLFLERTVEACYTVFMLGGDFMIENPLLRLLWETDLINQLITCSRALAVDLDQCAFGTPWRKPTRLLCSNELLEVVCVSCPGNHVHKKLQGKVWDAKLGRMVFRTKAAQVYPWALCATIAVQIAEIFFDPLAHLAASFAVCTPAIDRRRELHSSRPWKGHRQAETAQKALAAGYQLKRGAAKPLLEVEMEPGEAAQWMMGIPHPFTAAEELCPDLEAALLSSCSEPGCRASVPPAGIAVVAQQGARVAAALYPAHYGAA